MTTHRFHRWNWVLLGILLAAGIPGACQKEKTLEPGPVSDIRIERIEVDRSVLGPGDSTEVRAWVVQGRDPLTPVPAAAVEFGELPERGSGTFSKLESATDLAGWASTTFRPAEGIVGLVTIRVQVGASVQYTLLQVLPSAQESFSMDVTTPEDRTGLPADGESDLEVTIAAYAGEARSPVANLPLVLTAGDGFSDRNANGVADAGELMPSRDRNGNGVWDPEGSLPEEVQTDEQGIARFRYRAGLSVGPVYLRMTGGGTARELILQQHSLALTVTVSTEAREALADGASEVAVTARVTDWAGEPVGGVVVKFTAGESFTDTDGDGFWEAGEPYTDENGNAAWDAMGSMPASETTNYEGRASVRYRAGLVPGDASLRATTSNGWGQATLKLVPLAPAEQIELGLLRSELYADNASVAEGWTRVRDAAGVLLAGKPVRLVAGERFEDVNGDGVFTAGTDRLLDDLDGNGQWSAIGTLESIVITDAAGRAGFTYVAGTTTGRVWVRGSVDGVSAETSIDLETPPPVATIRFAPTFERMTVTGGGGATSNLLVAECLSATGDPVQAGTQVSFRITSSPGGGEALAGAVGGIVDAPTDDDGKAGATLLSGTRSGWVQVRASVGSFYQDAGIFIDPGPAARLTCLADSVSLVSGSYCWVRAWLYDAQNNPVRDGTPVHFEVDEGLIVPDQGGLTEDGEALAIYTAATPVSTGDGHAVITISGDGDNNGVVTCQSVILVPAPTGSICRILVEASAGEIGVRGTGAPEQVTLLARAYDCNENPARAGQRVGFRIIEGPGGGEYLSGCLCDTTSALTDELGIARATLNSGTKSGTVLVQAEVSGAAGISAHTPIAIAAGPPAYISIGVNQCNVLAEGYVNYENDVVALVYDTYRNPVRDRTAVWFTTDIGMVEGEDGGGLGSALTLRGVATGTWHGAGDGGIVTVFASTHGSEVLEASTTFIGSGDPYSSTFLLPTQSPVSVYADGRSEILMRVEVLDVNGLFVLPVDVEFRATYGDVPQSVRTEDGCHASYAEGDYRALTLERDDSYTVPDDGIGANDVVTASGGFGPYGDSFQVRLLTGNAAASRSAIDLETLPPSAQSYFTVTVKDGWGNPLGGHALALTATQGTVTSEGLTDSYGIAGGLSFIAPDSTGTVYVEVRDLDPNHGGNMILRKSISITQ